MGLMAGLHYWFPKMSGAGMYDESKAFWSWLLILVGFNVTFFPQFIPRSQGMPRRYWDYLPEFTFLNRVLDRRFVMIGVGFRLGDGLSAPCQSSGAQGRGNPWKALTLEWQSSSPPPHENFLTQPIVTNWPYEYRPEGGVVPMQGAQPALLQLVKGNR